MTRAQRTAERIKSEAIEQFLEGGCAFDSTKAAAIISQEIPVEKLVEALRNTLNQLKTMTHNHPDDAINNLIVEQAEAALRLWEEEK